MFKRYFYFTISVVILIIGLSSFQNCSQKKFDSNSNDEVSNLNVEFSPEVGFEEPDENNDINAGGSDEGSTPDSSSDDFNSELKSIPQDSTNYFDLFANKCAEISTTTDARSFVCMGLNTKTNKYSFYGYAIYKNKKNEIIKKANNGKSYQTIGNKKMIALQSGQSFSYWASLFHMSYIGIHNIRLFSPVKKKWINYKAMLEIEFSFKDGKWWVEFPYGKISGCKDSAPFDLSIDSINTLEIQQ